MRSKSLVSFFLIFFVLLSIVGLVVSPVGAVLDFYTFQGRDAYDVSADFSDPMDYGFDILLLSTLVIPSDWYLQYTMGFYFMNSSDTGYYIGLHQYRGEASIYVSPVVGGVPYGLDGIAYHEGLVFDITSSLFDDPLYFLRVNLNYDATTGLFRIMQNNAILVSNTYSGNNMTLTCYRVDNSMGREGISGMVELSAEGADNPDGSYDNPNVWGLDLDVVTNNVDVSDGGTVSYALYDALGALVETDADAEGYHAATGDWQGATLHITATPAAGHEFSSFYVSNTNTQFTLYPAGYYVSGGRLIANPQFTHIYASESGEVITYDAATEEQPLALIDPCSAWYNAGSISDYVWHNSTGYYRMRLISGAYYEWDSVWDAIWSGSSTLAPNSTGIFVSNPIVYQYWGGNQTVFVCFTYTNFNPSMIRGSSGSGDGGGGLPYDPNGFINWGNFATGGLVTFVMIMLLVLGVPMCALVMAPKIGMIGFVGMLCVTLSLSVLFFGLPYWLLIFVAMGVALMLFGLMQRT